MSLAGGQIPPIDANFHLQKSMGLFNKDLADKIWPKKDKEWKVSPLMPIRVKCKKERKMGVNYEKITQCENCNMTTGIKS